MKLIVWILVIWVAISFIYAKKNGETIDWSVWKQEFEDHPAVFSIIGIIVIIVIIVLLKILF